MGEWGANDSVRFVEIQIYNQTSCLATDTKATRPAKSRFARLRLQGLHDHGKEERRNIRNLHRNGKLRRVELTCSVLVLNNRVWRFQFP